MPVLKKINKFQGLKDLDVLVEESGLTSKYFNVVDFPSAIPKGASSFIIAGSRFLKENVELKIEILDSAGNTVYTEPIPNYLEGNARRVSIEVYDDVAPGDGFLYIVGELKDGHVDTTTSPNQSPFDPLLEELKQRAKFGNDVLDEIEELERLKEISQGNQQQSQIQNVPPAYQGIYNVRYVRPIFINSTIPNTEPIIFHGAPTITAREVVKGFIENSTADTTVTITGSGEILNLPDHIDGIDPAPDPLPFEGIKPIDFDSVENITKVLERLKNNRKNKIEVIRQPSLAVRGRVVRRASPEQEKSEFVINGLESGTENDLNKVSSALVGGTLTVNSPTIDTTKFPSDKFTIPTSFETKIKKVKNGGVCVPEDQFFVTEKDTGIKFPADILLPPGGGNTQVTMSYQPAPSQSISTTHFRSFADITVGNLRTFSGDVYKAKIYAKSRGTLGDFEKIYETPIESPQLLIDPFSTTGFTNTGYFYKQSIIDDYWTLSNGTKTQNDDKIIDGMLISGSNKGLNESIDLITSQSVELEYNVPYTIQFNTYYYKEDKQLSNNSNDVQKSARLEVYLSGSAITGVGGEDDEFLGAVDIPEGNNLEGQIDNVFNTFISSKTGDPKTQIIFRVKSGRFVISDVMLRPYSETNFNPEFFKTIVPMPHPLPKKPDNYDFLVEFFDINNNVAETIALTENVRFQGAAFNIDGGGNLLSGSMFMGSVEGSGIEMHGGSAYIRTIGYNGFDRTIAENKGGFIMFSGSVSESLQTSQSYEGVGLELVDAHGSGSSTDRFLRFRTNPSIFEVVTDQFFLGSETGAFISGSGGNIEISSSNFHLTNAGDVTMSGTINATAGNIGDFQIIDGQISGSNITFNANNSTIFKTDQGPGSDTSAAFDQLRDEYYIDFTPETESPDNFYIKMGPNFMVDKDGVLIASGAKFEGSVTASTGFIGGFQITSASLFSNNLFISGSPLTTGTYTHLNQDKYMFISTSKFNVKENGDVTGSSVLFDGGKIGGFTIDGHSLTSTGIEINDATQTYFISSSKFKVKHDGEISGSQVLFTGGKIAGWTIDSNNIFSDNLFIRSSGTIETADFASNLRGWRISAEGNGTAEFENARIRGTLSTAVFEKETVNAVGGQLYVANSTSITGSGITSASFTTMSVVNASGFTGSYNNDGEILSIKKIGNTGFSTEYVLVQSASRDFPDSSTNFAGKLFVVRGYSGSSATQSGSEATFVGDIQSTPQDYEEGQVLVSTGRSGSGYIRLNANPNDTTTPYIDIVERTGSAIYDVDLKARVGDLSGVNVSEFAEFGIAPSDAGFGIYTSNGYFTGGITATTGSITGKLFVHTGVGAANKIIIGTAVNGLSGGSQRDGLQINDNNYWYTTGQFKVGSATNFLSHDGSGDIQIQSQNFELDATGIEISSAEQSMSLGTSNQINMDGNGGTGGAPRISLTGGEISSSNFFVSTAGAVSASAFLFSTNLAVDTDATINFGESNYQSFAYGRDDNLKIVTGDFNLTTPKLIVSSSNNGVIALGSTPPTSPTDGNGIFLKGDGTFLFGDADGHRISFESSTLTVSSSAVNLLTTGTNKVKLSSIGTYPEFAMGTTLNTSVDGTNKGIYMNGSGSFLVRGDANNLLKFDAQANTLQLKSDTFALDASTIIVDSATNNGKIALGATPPTAHNSGNGFYADGQGRLLIGSGSGYGVQFDGTNLIMSSSTFVLGDKGNGAFISGSSDGLLTISSSGYHLSSSGEATFMTGSNQITFTPDGNIESDEYLIEKSRLFGSGADGDHTLTTGGSNIVSDDDSTTALVNNSSGTWTLQTDCYFDDLTINTGCTLLTNGFRLFVRGTLTMSGTAKIQNNGGPGGVGGASGGTAGAGGTAGTGATGNSLSAGTTGTTGGVGGGGSQQDGAGGGGSGGSGGFIFISARKIVNTCSNGSGIISEGGDGGNGGNSTALS